MAYGAHNSYVPVHAFDPRPDGIVTLLSRPACRAIHGALFRAAGGCWETRSE